MYELISPHLCDGSLVVSQPQEKDPGFIVFNGNSATPPLHLAHLGGLLRSRLSDQSLEEDRSEILYETFIERLPYDMLPSILTLLYNSPEDLWAWSELKTQSCQLTAF